MENCILSIKVIILNFSKDEKKPQIFYLSFKYDIMKANVKNLKGHNLTTLKSFL